MEYVYPNEVEVTWTVMIVLYPYITGLVAGAFIVSALYHVFDRTELKPVARFSLAASFVFLLFATAPLLVHLGHPERAFNIMVTPHFTSAMAGFGFIYLSYMILVSLEIWFEFRTDFIARAKQGGLIGAACRAVVLFDLRDDERIRLAGHKIVGVCAAIGIPMALLLHGYVGFLFGSLKANPWWSTPLMMVLFIFSAIVSGVAVLIVLYFVVHKFKRWELDQKCVRALGKYLWGFMIFAVALELLELLSVAYQQTAEWHIIRELITEHLMVSYVYLQYLVFSLIPFLLLGATVLVKMRDKVANALIFVSAAMLLCQVILMRWNIVIGGQLLSKSHSGFTEHTPTILGKEGLLVAGVILALPFVVLWVFGKVVPLLPLSGKKAAPAASE